MCGFGGVISHKNTLRAADVAGIASKVSFRGPDSCGIRILDELLNVAESGNTALFFNRLAIVDLDSRSDQPFEDDENLLMFNGEIYNYHELKEQLQKGGATFHTTSDTEVFFYALKKWGKEALPRLNGMFAFFWLDKKRRSFITGRDRLGIKPLYYHYNNGAFYFSSEIHSIVRLLSQKPSISAKAVEMYLWMQFVPTPYSVFENIYKIPPGCVIEATLDKIHSEPPPFAYWDAYKSVSSASEETGNSLEAILQDSVKRQMQADVPLGLFLSSGVDSSLLASVVNKYFSQDQDVNFFTISFGEHTATDESRDAQAFIKGFNNPHLINHLLQVDPKYMQDHIGSLYDYYDEPFGDYASLLNWAISKKAREFVTVAISGDGADELFWGYNRYNKWRDLQKLNAIPALSSTISKTAGLFGQVPVAKKIRKTFRHDPVERHFDLFLLPAFRDYFAGNAIMSNNLWALDNVELIEERNDLPSILDIKTYLSDAMLYKVDRSSMATSLEVRVPYLDNKVLDYALRTNLNKKSNSLFKNKAVLKSLLYKLAPHYNIKQPKKGFSFPLKKWLLENWRDQVNDVVTSDMLISMGLEPEYFLRVINSFFKNTDNSSVEVWYLFNLGLWKQHLDNMTDKSNG
jgi:asparagine synthase (glutamine-hydrolysing)